MKKSIKLIKLLLFISLLSYQMICRASQPSPHVLEKAKKAIVTIDTRATISAYKTPGNWTGTGFITDKKNGFIVTNHHITSPASIGTYLITFYNGKQAEANLVYYDLWQDYAILKINTSDIPNAAEEIIFSKMPVAQNQNVLVVGNAEGKDFSFHTGYISGLYEIAGDMPQSSYVINLNSTGGASGSPILNEKNEAIGLLYGGGKTYVFALKGSYVQKGLDSLKQDKEPIRKHIGVMSELYSLDKAVKHRNFPKEQMDEFLTKFPDSRNKVVSVQYTINGSPSEGIMKPGDIIWEVNGIPLGGDLAVLDNEMDKTDDNNVKLTIYRDGKKIDRTIQLYDINANKVNNIVNFAGALFFESDDYVSAKSGIPLKALTIANVQIGSSFSVIPTGFLHEDRTLYRLLIRSIDKYTINSLNDLITNIPNIVKQKFVTMRFKNYLPYFQSYNNTLVSSHNDMVSDIVFDSIDIKPRILKYDTKSMEWVTEDINP